MSEGAIDQTGGGDTSKTSSDDSQSANGNGKTWGQWAVEKVIAAGHVAAQGAMKVKGYAIFAVKFVTGAAASKFPGIAEPSTASIAKNVDVVSGDTNTTTSVQDFLDGCSTTTRTLESGKKPVTRSLIDTGLIRIATVIARSRSLAETIKQNAMSAFTPGDGDKELAKIITAALSSFPSLLQENVWISSSGKNAVRSFDDMPLPINSDNLQEDSRGTAPISDFQNSGAGAGLSETRTWSLQQAEHQEIEPEEEEKLDPIGPEKLMELWAIGNGTLDCTVNSIPMDSENFLFPQSPKTPESSSSSAVVTKLTNAKAEAFADAHRSRVMTEANAYVESELSKAEAHAQKMHAKAESQRRQEESRAMESLKKEELRAELLVHNAEVKAAKLLAEAKSKAGSMGATAQEEHTKTMADAKTKAERWLAEIEETRQREIAELHDRVEQMILMREFPLPLPEHKKESVVKKVKEKVISHIRGY